MTVDQAARYAPYERADAGWLASCALGLGVHWTTATAPRAGASLPYAEAVRQFRVAAFTEAVCRSGAEYVIFTLTHALHTLPCPSPVVERILPGRTMQRDLVGELAQALEAVGVKFIAYYNHACNAGLDPEWEEAVGYHDPSKSRLADNLCAIVACLGARYGDLIRAWWFDSGYRLDPSGPQNSVTTDMRGFRFPWEAWTQAAKAGFPDRLVTYNAGLNQTHLYTEHQDYWSGEIANLDTPPTEPCLPGGLPWHGWTCLDDPRWVYADNRQPPAPPRFADAHVLAFLQACRRCPAPMAFNVLVFQDGSIAEASVAQLGRVRALLDG